MRILKGQLRWRPYEDEVIGKFIKVMVEESWSIYKTVRIIQPMIPHRTLDSIRARLRKRLKGEQNVYLRSLQEEQRAKRKTC